MNIYVILCCDAHISMQCICAFMIAVCQPSFKIVANNGYIQHVYVCRENVIVPYSDRPCSLLLSYLHYHVYTVITLVPYCYRPCIIMCIQWSPVFLIAIVLALSCVYSDHPCSLLLSSLHYHVYTVITLVPYCYRPCIIMFKQWSPLFIIAIVLALSCLDI